MRLRPYPSVRNFGNAVLDGNGRYQEEGGKRFPWCLLWANLKCRASQVTLSWVLQRIGEMQTVMTDASKLLESLDRGISLPAHFYTDPTLVALEQEKIFRRTWQYMGPLEQRRGAHCCRAQCIGTGRLRQRLPPPPS
jgi:hypothetical protein